MYFLFELWLWELLLIEEIGSKDWVFRVVFEKIQIIFLGCFVWFFVLFHVLTINALGCHINFKPFFFFSLVYEYWYRERKNYFYPKSKHKTVQLFYFMFQTIRLFKPCSIKKTKILILYTKILIFYFLICYIERFLLLEFWILSLSLEFNLKESKNRNTCLIWFSLLYSYTCFCCLFGF